MDSDFNRRAQECTNHRMRQISYEAIYADKYQYGEPVKEVYTFKCTGSCQQTTQLITKNK
jgi:nitrate reductase alpha subunit